MTPNDLIYQGTLGGPGLSGYSYQASVYCIGCGEAIYNDIATEVAHKLSGTDDPRFSNGEVVPQPIFFGEHEVAQFCAECDHYLYGGELN